MHLIAINYAKQTPIRIIGIYQGGQNQGYIRRSTLKDANFLIAEPIEFNIVAKPEKYSFHELLDLPNFDKIVFYDVDDYDYHFCDKYGLDHLLKGAMNQNMKSSIVTIHSMLNNFKSNQQEKRMRREILMRMIEFIYKKFANYNSMNHRVFTVKFN